MSVTTLRELEDDTAFEQFALNKTIYLLPTKGSASNTYDVGTRTISVGVESVIGGELVEEVKNTLLPLLFGAAWKVLDLSYEFALASASLAPKQSGRWTIQEKRNHATSSAGRLPPISPSSPFWPALCGLYDGTAELRHSLVHRRAHVDANGSLVGEDKSGAALTSMPPLAQYAFCRLVLRLSGVVLRSRMSPREESDMISNLITLAVFHGHTLSGPSVTVPPLVLTAELPGDGVLDVPALMDAARRTLPAVTWVDLELRTSTGVLVGELEGAPQSRIAVDPAAPPPWLSRK